MGINRVQASRQSKATSTIKSKKLVQGRQMRERLQSNY